MSQLNSVLSDPGEGQEGKVTLPLPFHHLGLVHHDKDGDAVSRNVNARLSCFQVLSGK